VGIALGITAIVGAALHTSSGRASKWLSFYIWKLSSGKVHGRQRAGINDASIYYETYGAGPPVLVLHGGLGSMEGMAYQIMELAKSHFVIAPDTRGHGRSTDSSAPMSYALIADDMLKLLDHLHIKRVDVVGWSDGGVVALDLAMRHPERVSRLVAISANFDADGLQENSTTISEIPPVPLRYKLLAPDPAHWPALYRNVVTMWRTQPHYTLDDLSQIKAPTLIMAGQFDVIRREHTDRLARSIPGSWEVIVQGSAHDVPNEKSSIVNNYILRFLDE
jgi:pimeloyl-ACP methyl ester carboxylesterase